MKRKRVNRVRPEAWWVIEKQSTGEKQVVVYMWGAVPEEDEIGNILKPCPCGSGPQCYPGPDGKCYKIDNSIDPVVLSGEEDYGEILLNWTASDYTRPFFYRLFKNNVIIYEGIDTEYQDTDVYVDNTYTYFVQVISVDGENESPPSNYVTITLKEGEVEPPDPLEFKPDLFYYVDRSDVNRRVVKVENVLGTWTITAEYFFPADIDLPGMDQLLHSQADQYVAVLKNTDVVVSASVQGFSTNNFDGIWLFDKDLNLKKFVKLDKADESNTDSSPFLSIDEDDNIYKPFMYSTTSGRVVRKYTSDLNTLLWESSPASREAIVGFNVTRNYVIERVVVTFGDSFLRWTDRETGDRIKSEIVDLSGFTAIENFRDGGFYIVGAYGGGSSIWYRQYNDDGDVILDIKPHPDYTGFNRPKAGGAMLNGDHLIPYNEGVRLVDSLGSLIYIQNIASHGIGKAGWGGTDLVYIMSFSNTSATGSIFSLVPSTQVLTNIHSYSGDIRSKYAFGMFSENWQLTKAPQISSNISLDVVPQSGKPPLIVNVSIFADNKSDVSKDIILRLNLEDIYTMTIPAGESRSHYLTKTISNIGTHVFEFGSITRTVIVSDSTGGSDIFEGTVNILSGANAVFTPESPTAEIGVMNKATGASSYCQDPIVADSCYVTYKTIDSCFRLTSNDDKSDIAARIAQAANKISGLSAEFSGFDFPKIAFSGEPGDADNGEVINVTIPASIETNPILNGSSVALSGGSDGAPVFFFISLTLDGEPFAVGKVEAGDTAETVAQNLLAGCQAVDQSRFTFSLNGTSLTVRATSMFSLDLYVGETGVQYSIEHPEALDTTDTTDPTAPLPPDGTLPPPTGAMELALVFLQGIHFDVWINGGLVPKTDPFDYTFDNNGVTAGVKVVDIVALNTFELDASQIRVAGLNNYEFGAFVYKVVNKNVDADLDAINALDNGNPEFWGQPALANPLGIIVGRHGDTVYGTAYPDPYFYQGWRHDPINQPDNRIFEAQWSDTGKAAISLFKYGENL